MLGQMLGQILGQMPTQGPMPMQGLMQGPPEMIKPPPIEFHVPIRPPVPTPTTTTTTTSRPCRHRGADEAQ